jgi:hypothetical protein
MPNDDGEFLFTNSEMVEFVVHEAKARPLFREFLSSYEYLNGGRRWCLWLKDADPALIRSCPSVVQRIEAVRRYRLASSRETTRKLAATPSLFGEIRAPQQEFVLIPRHSSENRVYIPLSFFPPTAIPADSCLFVEDANLYHFGVLSSVIHTAWVRTVCGRIKSDFRYSVQLVYNNFPWPDSNAAQREDVEAAAQAVIAARRAYLPPVGMSSLADLYDPLTMPAPLLKAHHGLDRAVDRCYRGSAFQSERERVELLFARYEKAQAPLLPPTPAPRAGKRTSSEGSRAKARTRGRTPLLRPPDSTSDP